MNSKSILTGAAAGFVTFALSASVVEAADLYAYPNAGQSQEQQSQDRFECHQWATRESGYDPSSPTPRPDYGYSSPPPPPEQDSGGFLNMGDGGFFEGGGMLGDAATGAGLGAAGGAIAGDVGEGAAIGALAGTVFGALNRSSSNSKQQQQQAEYDRQRYAEYQYQRQRAADEQYRQRENYNRAYGACMRARNYTVD
jgi:hypothetical protein